MAWQQKHAAMFRRLFTEAVASLELETEQIECHAVLSSIQHLPRLLTERTVCVSLTGVLALAFSHPIIFA